MINITSIQAFVDTAEDLFYEQGNCGRKIRRFIDRSFVNGSARLQVLVPHTHLFQFAYGVGQMKWATQMANDSVSCDMVDGPMFEMDFAVASLDATSGTFDIVLAAEEIPTTVKSRQQFLKRIAHGLRRYIAIAELGYGVDDLDDFFQDLFGMPGATEQVDTAKYLAGFDRLIASDYSELTDTTSYVIALAEYLNPGVTVELRRLDEEYDRIIDAAFANHAMPSAVAVNLLFATN